MTHQRRHDGSKGGAGNVQFFLPSLFSRPLPFPLLPYPLFPSGAKFEPTKEIKATHRMESLAALEHLSKNVDSEPLIDQLDVELHKSVAKVCFPSRNRYGRPYISGRPLLTCDRKKIVDLFEKGMKKIRIAKQLGITHSCVSKVLRRYQETGLVDARVCRTASCSCPGSADVHDVRYCKHLNDQKARVRFTIENLLLCHPKEVVYSSLIS